MSKLSLLCPYCPQVYSDGVHLAAHVHRTHRDEAGPIERAAAVSGARTVADVNVTSSALIDHKVPVTELVGNTARIASIRADLTDLRTKLDAVADTLDRAEAAAMRPEVVRRTTLSQVLDALLDAGHLNAYALVSEMLRDAS